VFVKQFSKIIKDKTFQKKKKNGKVSKQL